MLASNPKLGVWVYIIVFFYHIQAVEFHLAVRTSSFKLPNRSTLVLVNPTRVAFSRGFGRHAQAYRILRSTGGAPFGS